jgi:hypothetical protein
LLRELRKTCSEPADLELQRDFSSGLVGCAFGHDPLDGRRTC